MRFGTVKGMWFKIYFQVQIAGSGLPVPRISLPGQPDLLPFTNTLGDFNIQCTCSCGDMTVRRELWHLQANRAGCALEAILEIYQDFGMTVLPAGTKAAAARSTLPCLPLAEQCLEEVTVIC